VSGLVDRAQRRGLVRRIPSMIDRRSVRVSLTEEGRSLVGEVSSRFEEDVAKMLSPLSSEETRLLTSLLSRVDEFGWLPRQSGGDGRDLVGLAD
jgi:DNA-binding MarR family transcriptional regulator